MAIVDRHELAGQDYSRAVRVDEGIRMGEMTEEQLMDARRHWMMTPRYADRARAELARREALEA